MYIAMVVDCVERRITNKQLNSNDQIYCYKDRITEGGIRQIWKEIKRLRDMRRAAHGAGPTLTYVL